MNPVQNLDMRDDTAEAVDRILGRAIRGPVGPSSQRPLDRSTFPGVPAAVADLWAGWGYGGTLEPHDVKVALDAATSIVNAMAQGTRFAVTLSGQVATAGTDLKTKRVAITTAALADTRLSLLERVGVTTAMAIHEAGHGRISEPMSRAAKRAFGQGDQRRAERAARLSNILEDNRLEARTVARWSAYGGLFALGMWWVAQRYPTGKIERLPQTREQAVNFVLASVRYRHWSQWSSDPAVQAERTWWEQWSDRAIASDKPKDHVAALTEALERIERLPEAVEQPDEQPALPGPQAEQDEGGEDGDLSEDISQPGGMPESDEDEDEDEDGEAEGGEDADDWDDSDTGSAGEQDESEQDGEDGEDGEDDEPLDAPGAGWSDEADDEADGGQADADDVDGPGTEGGEVEYRQRDGEVSGDEDPLDADAEVGDVTFGPSSDEGTERDTMEGAEQDTWDALENPLPAHATEAVADDDRNRDIAIGRTMAATAQHEAKDAVRVTHLTDEGPVSRTVQVVPVDQTVDHRAGTDPSVQGALRAAFTSRRTSRDDRAVSRSGRVSGHRAFRVRAGFDNVFMRRESVSPDRLDLHLLVDASGSMANRAGGWGRSARGPRRVEEAATLVANMAEALSRLPYVRVHVWAHNSGAGTTLWDVFDSRKGHTLGRIRTIRATGGNNDASAIRALGEIVRRERSPRERSVMVVLSDGAPCEPQDWVLGAAEAVREQGVGVVSVAIAGGLTKMQEACYGRDNVVPWTGDWDALGRGIAQIMGRLA